jgi:transcriptional regulator with XRE-family HTH domain
VIVTIKDVAQRAGVSPKTVSRVLNNETHVRPQLRETVMRVIEELNYKPNMFARGLSSARSYLIGLFIYDPYWSGYATDIQLGALRRCRELGYHLVIEPIDPFVEGAAQRGRRKRGRTATRRGDPAAAALHLRAAAQPDRGDGHALCPHLAGAGHGPLGAGRDRRICRRP